MFDKKYKNAMDSVNIDATKRDEILDKIMQKEENNKRKNPALPWRIAFACTACIALVLGVLFTPTKNTVKKKVTTKKPSVTIASYGDVLKVSKSYDEIYELIKPDNNYAVYDGTAADDMEIVEEGMVETETSAKPGAINGSNNGSTSSKGETLTDTNSSAEKEDFSTTTEQVEGVTEADIVKTDGEYIYYINDTTLSIVKADGKNSTLISQTELSNSISKDLYGEMFLKDDRIIILKTEYYASASNLKDDMVSSSPYVMYDYNGYDSYKQKVLIEIYDISNKSNPKKVASSCQDGTYHTSRMIGDYIYIISNCYINVYNIDKDDPATFVPSTETNGVSKLVPADSIYRYEGESYSSCYTVISAFNYKDGTLSDTSSILGGTDNIYCSQNNIILADVRYNDLYDENEQKKVNYVVESTVISKLAISGGNIEYKTSGKIDGTLNNQFFIDEYNGYFRFVTTVTKGSEKRYKFENSVEEVVSYTQVTSAALTVLDSELKKVGEITDLAAGERVYSVRFMGDTAYFVTFRQTDPLFSADLSDPTNPKILGELKIPGFSEYMYPYGDGLLLGFGMDADEITGRTSDLKLSMFNIQDPANVTEQDKTIVNGCQYSPALSNHKAMLVNPSKNLIGFAATEDWRNEKYMIYEYTGDSFALRAVLDINNQYNYYAMTDIRGLFVGNYFYVVSDQSLQVFDINTFEPLAKVNF
ncbi:MAG: beta-propeller domain-containing protein [Clostridia bacterium]|nr:beta-propeller domain-containing protein [Clostridia bacterium]